MNFFLRRLFRQNSVRTVLFGQNNWTGLQINWICVKGVALATGCCILRAESSVTADPSSQLRLDSKSIAAPNVPSNAAAGSTEVLPSVATVRNADGV